MRWALPGASAIANMLEQHIRDRLADCQVPREIVIFDELPRNPTGKILRRDPRAHVVGA